MEPSYEWITFGKTKKSDGISFQINNIIDIMGAPISEKEEFQEKIDTILKYCSILCISGELKKYLEGQPASNYRFKDDDQKNENVINNYFYLFQKYQELTHGKPIFVTTIPRSWRKYSWFIGENGGIIRKDEDYRRECNDPEGRYAWTGPPGGREDTWDIGDSNLMDMLRGRGVELSHLIKLRESCSSAKYHSYMIDMISFLYQLHIETNEFHIMFQPEYRSITSITGGDKAGNWIPDEKTNYLYFEDCKDNHGYVFFVPRKESIDHIYHILELAINPYENNIKAMIRNHLSHFNIDRWSDFDVNDTDDAFTILMILHAYSCSTIDHEPITLTKDNYDIKKNLESIMEPWFERLNSI